MEDGFIVLMIMCVGSGRIDGWLFFIGWTCLFGLICALRLGDGLSGYGNGSNVVSMLGLDGQDLQVVAVCIGLICGTFGLSMLCKMSLNKYSPASCVFLYLCCVVTVLNDACLDMPFVGFVFCCCILALSFTSNAILRLHVAASVCCCNFVLFRKAVNEDFEKMSPSVFLVLGFGACISHDFVVPWLGRFILDSIHALYVLACAFVVEQYVSEVLNAQDGKLQALRYGEIKTSSVAEFASPLCVFVSCALILRALISPGGEFVSLGTRLNIGAFCGLSLIGVLAKFSNESFEASPAFHTVCLIYLYCLVSEVHKVPANNIQWLTMPYLLEPAAVSSEGKDVKNSSSSTESGPPPFVLLGAEDTRVQNLIIKVNNLEKAQQEKRKSLNALLEQKGGDENLVKCANLHADIARLSIDKASKAEEITILLRQIMYTREPQVLANLRKYIRDHTPQGKTSSHYVSLRRQLDNAYTNLDWLTEEHKVYQLKYIQADNDAQKEGRQVIIYLARCRLMAAGNNRAREQINEIIADLKQRFVSSDLMHPGRFDYFLDAAQKRAKTPSLKKLLIAKGELPQEDEPDTSNQQQRTLSLDTPQSVTSTTSSSSKTPRFWRRKDSTTQKTKKKKRGFRSFFQRSPNKN